MEKKLIYLSGDSTVMSYSEAKRPFVGWGEKLLEALGDVEIEKNHRENSPFDTETLHIGEKYIVDNCAMAGRSSKTFREEGRLKDIENNIKEGDYLLFGFGHNDANAEKEERYVSLENFESSLKPFIDVARERKATPIIYSSIALCPCKENRENENIVKLDELLPKYALEMKKIADKYKMQFIDVQSISKEKLTHLSQEEIYSLYREDHVHLVDKGALYFAKIIGENIVL